VRAAKVGDSFADGNIALVRRGADGVRALPKSGVVAFARAGDVRRLRT